MRFALRYLRVLSEVKSALDCHNGLLESRGLITLDELDGCKNAVRVWRVHDAGLPSQCGGTEGFLDKQTNEFLWKEVLERMLDIFFQFGTQTNIPTRKCIQRGTDDIDKHVYTTSPRRAIRRIKFPKEEVSAIFSVRRERSGVFSNRRRERLNWERVSPEALLKTRQKTPLRDCGVLVMLVLLTIRQTCSRRRRRKTRCLCETIIRVANSTVTQKIPTSVHCFSSRRTENLQPSQMTFVLPLARASRP